MGLQDGIRRWRVLYVFNEYESWRQVSTFPHKKKNGTHRIIFGQISSLTINRITKQKRIQMQYRAIFCNSTEI